ncbi:hypothetical protein V1522DRAFT_418664 [Lipomyces starkeyi]
MSTEFRKALSFIETEVRDEHHELECNVTLTPHEFSELTYEVGYSAPPEITGFFDCTRMSYDAATSAATIETFENFVRSNMPVTIGRRIRQSVETCLADLMHIRYFGGLAHIHLWKQSHSKLDCLLGFSNVDDIISNALLVEGEALSWYEKIVEIVKLWLKEGRDWVSEKDRFRNILKNKMRIDEDNLFENIEYENRVWFGKLSALGGSIPAGSRLRQDLHLMERIINNPSKKYVDDISLKLKDILRPLDVGRYPLDGNQPISQ